MIWMVTDGLNKDIEIVGVGKAELAVSQISRGEISVLWA